MDIPEPQPVAEKPANEGKPAAEDDLSPAPIKNLKILCDDKEMLKKAIQKWIKFNQSIWVQVNGKLETDIRRSGSLSTWLRTSIIVISAAITTMSSIGEIPRVIITVVAGVMTALTGVEAYMKLGDRQASAAKLQREIEHLRDDLRYQWFNEVEVPEYACDFSKRLDAARRLLQEGPEKYNLILDKYAMKAEKGAAPGDQGPAAG